LHPTARSYSIFYKIQLFGMGFLFYSKNPN
jgi:hypothetical protein